MTDPIVVTTQEVKETYVHLISIPVSRWMAQAYPMILSENQTELTEEQHKQMTDLLNEQQAGKYKRENLVEDRYITFEISDEEAERYAKHLTAKNKLAKIVSEFEDKLAEAERFADEHNLSFDIYPDYGMGGTYSNGSWSSSSNSC